VFRTKCFVGGIKIPNPMAWFYVLDNQRKGPIEQSEFEGLIQQGVIADSTLVWQEGMANWEAYREVSRPVAAAVAAPSAASVAAMQTGQGGVVCGHCGQSFALDQVVKIGTQYVCAGCKPLAVQKLREGIVSSDVEQLRKAHINHEASVKSIGLLYFLGAAFLLLAAFGTFAAPGQAGRVIAALFIGLAALQIWAGIGLRKLRRWARIPSGILSGLGLLAFPLGTLINGYILYLLFSKKGAMVFSEEYRRAIEQTPHIKYRTSLVVWILLAFLLLLIGGGLVAFFVSRH
jgi:disulfide bond formation protein DsbB